MDLKDLDHFESPLVRYLDELKQAELAALDEQRQPAPEPTHCLSCGQRLKRKQRPDFFPDYIRAVK